MSPTEQQREIEQRRVSDIVMQTLSLIPQKRDRNDLATYVAAFAFAGSVIVAIAISQAEKVVKPVSEKVLINENNILHNSRSTEKILEAVAENNRLIREMSKK